MRVKLTDAICSQKPPKKGEPPSELWDLLMPGLCLRIYPSGAKTFSAMPRDADGKQRRVSFKPRYPLLSLAAARQRVRDLEIQRQQGAPLPTPPPKTPRPTVKKVFESWVENALSSVTPGIRKQTETRVRSALEPYFDLPYHRISSNDIQNMIDARKIKTKVTGAKYARVTGGTQAAWNLYSNLRGMVRWASKRQRTDDPTEQILNVDVPKMNPPRARYLTHEELRAVWLACDELGWPYGPASKLLILTGVRKMQVGALPWSEINFQTAEWLIPASRCKSAREFLMPLSRQAVALLQSLPRVANPLGLALPNENGKPLTAWHKMCERLQAISGTSDWTHHDHRRTIKTNLTRLRVDKEVRDAILQHAKTGMDRVYDLYDHHEEKRIALQRWADEVDRIVTGEPVKVVKIRG